MIKSKIDPSKVKELKWKEYVKLIQKDFKLAASKGVDKVAIVMASDYTFSCGETHALLLMGKQSVMVKAFKDFKADKERMNLKDFSRGFCHFEKNDDGSNSIKIAIKGFGKPARMKKNSRKMMKKLGLNLTDIIKGEFVDEVVEDINEANQVINEDKKVQYENFQDQAEVMKADDDATNDTKLLGKVAKEFSSTNKQMNKEVVSLMKLSKSQAVIYTDKHIKIAENAFRSAASLLDKYEEIDAKRKNLAKTASKITELKENIIKNDLVKKYETIWKKVQIEYKKQLNQLSEPLSVKFEELDQLLNEIKAEFAQ